MTERDILSRPVRAAAVLLGRDEADTDHLFRQARVMVRLEEPHARNADARQTFQFAVNQSLRFCPNVAVCLPESARSLARAAATLAIEIHGEGHGVEFANLDEAPRFQAIVNVGNEILPGPSTVTVNSNGWLARGASGSAGADFLYGDAGPPNPLGALAAACLGAGSAFLMLIGRRPLPVPMELSLFTHEVGAPGSLGSGPVLPRTPLKLDALLIGCGAVANGWAYALKRLPIVGHVEAIDRQSLRRENLGSYVAATRKGLGKPKADLIRDYLGSRIRVTSRPEEWELFRIRLAHGQSLPRLVVSGLDNVETRHSVQRLWPETVIDMAAGGFNAQVIVKNQGNNGFCLLGALKRPEHEEDNTERLARETGLHPERIRREPTTPITVADVEAAPPDERASLEAARQQGQLICGRVTQQNLHMERQNPDFAPAVPFVTAFSGVVGAGECVKWLLGHRYAQALHYQHSALSGRGRALAMRCEESCECQKRRRLVGALQPR